VILLSQFSVNPSEAHIRLALHIVKYVASTLQARIVYDGNANLIVHGDQGGFIAYADADWGSNPVNRRSTTGYVVKLAHAAISWASVNQKTIAHSSTEAEYMALSDTSRQISWIKSLMMEIGFDIGPVTLCGDNQGSLFLAANPAQDKQTKHIDIRFHYIKEVIENKKILLYFIPTHEQAADLLTKNLPGVVLKRLCRKLGLYLKDIR
jgi:hypothetical protein